VLEGEFEIHRRSQPSQAAFSLLGNRLPAPVDPRLNLNNQPWSQPVVFDSVTGTLRFEQAINSQWRWSAQAGTQQLKTQDREAFPFGCSAEGNFDRFCSDGTFDLYDFRSENERRRQDAAQLQLKGKFVTGAVSHDIGFALLSSRVRNRFQGQAYNFVGVGNVQGTVVLPPDPTLGDTNTNRDERSLEFSVNDAMHFGERTTLWLGLRHTQLDRSSITTRNTRATSFSESLTTPWAALSYKITPAVTAYTSWGQGVEVAVVPNRPAQYSNAGQALPALKSRQWEAGLKGDMQPLAWNVALFSITRPVTNLDTCANLGLACTGAFDGEQRHRGVEGSAQWTSGPWRLGGALSVLDAERRGSTIQPAVNGQHPVNVPAFTARLQAGYRFAALPSSELAAQLSHEAKRNVLPDGSLTLPAWTRLDVAFHYDRKIAGTDTRWTVGVDNVADRKYWRESPFQFGHAYLYPGAPRTLRVGVTAAL
jgi:iron complex outermembrane receptor protein